MTRTPFDALAPTDRLHGLLMRAGETLLAHAHEALRVQAKGDGSPVTDADLAAERVIVEGLASGWPEDGILSEEGARRQGTSGATWVVDPLDGTSAFVEGLAHWGPTVARLAGGRVTEGAIYLPRTGEYWHVHGRDALHLTGGGVRTLGAPRPGPGPLTAVLLVPSELHKVGRLRWAGKARCLGGTAAHLGLVARGSARAAIVAEGWSVWDVAAGLALIDAVGGTACALTSGTAPSLEEGHPRPAFAAGDPEAVDALLHAGAWQPVAASER